MAQQEEHIEVLIGSLTGLFGIEIVDAHYVPADINARDDNGSPTFVTNEMMRTRANEIVTHIRDQSSFAGSCFDRLSPNERVLVEHIGRYAMNLVTRLMDVKAERDDNNEPLDRDTLPVLPAHLVSLRTSAFIQNVLDPSRAHAAQFWTAEKLDEVENEHREVRSMYESDDVVRKAIDSTTSSTTFDEAWDPMLLHPNFACFVVALRL